MENRTASVFDYVRMCESCASCKQCVFDHGYNCHEEILKNPKMSNELILKWCDEHPQKTYAQDFFEKFPNAQKDLCGNPLPCRKDVFGSPKGDCDSICHACWNEVMLEEIK